MNKIRSMQDLRDRLEGLANIASDFEAAHGEEDKIWGEVLEAIAEDRFVVPNEAARLALTSRQIGFARECA
ncbi:hypothetical protein LCGC14_3125470 [marine sediment metagenome]|uniref:Uncharacterized protein n=1 Tax=marine sediment metagenome TaxID=412755 RepID=A0A0F8W1A7_9ZZZZ